MNSFQEENIQFADVWWLWPRSVGPLPQKDDCIQLPGVRADGEQGGREPRERGEQPQQALQVEHDPERAPLHAGVPDKTQEARTGQSEQFQIRTRNEVRKIAVVIWFSNTWTLFRALGEGAKEEFNELFDTLIVDVCDAMTKYSDIVKQLEALLDLEKETLVIKKKVATFSLDYDDDLVITKRKCIQFGKIH